VLQAWDAADVLLVFDNSCSMLDEQVLLAETAPLVLDSLDASSVDWHVGVVTTDLDSPADSGRLRSFDGALWGDPSSRPGSTPRPAPSADRSPASSP
jgi:hypothetical protein